MQVTGDNSQTNFYGPYNDVQGNQVNNYIYSPIVFSEMDGRSLECGCRGSVPISFQPLFYDWKTNDSLGLWLYASRQY